MFRQLSAVGTPQAKDGLDRGGLEQLFSFPSLELGLSRTEAEQLANAALAHAGGRDTMRFPALTAFLMEQAEADGARGEGGENCPQSIRKARQVNHVPLEVFRGRFEARNEAREARSDHFDQPARLADDPIAQSIAKTVREGRSELRLAGGDEESRLACAVHLRNAFRKRRKNLGGDPGGIDDCSVAASDLPGLLQDMGVAVTPTQSAFLIQARKLFDSKCCRRQVLHGRAGPGGKTEMPVRAGDVLAFFRELLSQ
ncbi:unnamed protein product [Sphacelaria rigidula]